MPTLTFPITTSTFALEIMSYVFFVIWCLIIPGLFGVITWRWVCRQFKTTFTMRMALFICIAQTCYIGGTKIVPQVGDKIGNFVYWSTMGRLEDPAGVVAQYAEAAAVTAFEAETAAIIGVATTALASASIAINELDDYVHERDLKLVYIAGDVPRDWAGVLDNHNIAITAERQTCVNGIMTVWFRYSRELSDAAAVSATFKIGGENVTVASYTNSFPDAETINGAPCYRYDYDLRTLVGTRDVVVVAPYEADFGGPVGTDLPLSTPADIEIVTGGSVTNVGLTGWVDVPHMAPLRLRAEGGAVVEADIDGIRYAGVTENEVTL